MQQSERHKAKLAGQRTYVTGRPCKNGHTSPRATLSGSCIECLYSSRKFAPVDLPLVDIKLRAFEIHVDQLSNIVHGFAILRFPNVPRHYIVLDKKPTKVEGGAGLYAYRCHAEDEQALYAAANELLSSVIPDMAAVRGKLSERALRIQETLNASEVKELPAFKEELPYLNDKA